MKQFYFYLITFLFSGLALTACSDDDKDPGDLPGSNLTTAEIKKLLESETNAFINEMQGLSDEQGLDVLVYFSQLFAEEDYLEPSQPYQAISRAVEKITAADFYYTYTWTDGEWILTENGKQAEFLFPSSEKSNSNDAKIVATGVDSNVTIKDEDGDEVVLPKEVKAVVTVGTKEVANLNVKVDWVSADKVPNSAAIAIGLTNYSLDMQVDKAKKNTANAVLKKGSKNLINLSADIDTDVDAALNSGNLDKANANATIEMTDDLAFVGVMDVKKYIDALDKLDDEFDDNYDKYDYQTADKLYTEGKVKAFNENSNLVLNSRKEGKDGSKLATLKARVKTYSYGYTDMVYELQFDDETAIDANVYFGTGFDSVLNSWNKFLSSF